VSALPNANTDRRMTQCLTSDSFAFRKLLYSCTDGLCHSSTHPGTSLHLTQSYQAFTASDKCWGEKPWVRGYTIDSLKTTDTADSLDTLDLASSLDSPDTLNSSDSPDSLNLPNLLFFLECATPTPGAHNLLPTHVQVCQCM